MKPSPSSKGQAGGHRTVALVVAGALAVVLLTGLLVWQRSGHSGLQDRDSSNKLSKNGTPAGAFEATTPKDMPPASNNADKSETAGPPAAKVQAALATLRQIAQQFRDQLAKSASGDKEQAKLAARQLLARLRDALRNLPTDVAAAAIVQFLDSGEDAATGLPFNLEAGGVLADAPSMRTALLDMLGQLDPSASVTYARRIFDGSGVADEWALAMRNMGWQNQGGAYSEELRGRLSQLLDNQQWLGSPTNGFLESFDLAVHLGGLTDLDAMASVLRLQDSNGNPVENGVTHAAYLALDRMTINNPDQTIGRIAADPDFLSWAPEHRGALMSRANVASPTQRSAVETYLQTLSQHPQELETFTNLFPNRNVGLGPALVSTPTTPMDFARLFAQDQGSLGVVNQWLNDGRFSGIRGNLQQISARLTEFVNAGRAAPSGVNNTAPQGPSGNPSR